MTKYKVISGIMQGLIFNGHPVSMGGESRVWNDDSTGQAFLAENCTELTVTECQECQNMDQCESVLWYPDTQDSCYLMTCKACQAKFAEYIDTIGV